MSSGQQTTTDWTEGERGVSGMVFGEPEEALHGMQAVVGRKWNPVLLYYLLTEGPLSFSDLKSRVDGISSKMLSESLSDLEKKRLVTRTLLSDQPVRVEYTLTERGESLETLLVEMVQWGSENQEDR